MMWKGLRMKRRVQIHSLPFPQHSTVPRGKKRGRLLSARGFSFASTVAGPEAHPQSGSAALGKSTLSSSYGCPQCSVRGDIKRPHWASPATQKPIGSRGLENSPGHLAPFGDTGVRAADKLWLKAVSSLHPQASAHCRGSAGRPASRLFSCAEMQRARMWLPVKSSKLSQTPVLNTWLWPCLSFALVFLFHETFNKV